MYKYSFFNLALSCALLSQSPLTLSASKNPTQQSVETKKRFLKMSNSAKFLIAGSFLLTSTLGAITVNKYFFSRKNRSNEEKDTNNALEISNKNKQIFSPKPIHKERNYNAGTNSEIQSAISSNKRINTSKIYPKSNKVNIESQASQETDINQSKREREDLLIENKESEKLEREEIERKKSRKG